MLVCAIQAVGGPAYQFRQIDPEDNGDGSQPGGNIQVGFLFRTMRGLSSSIGPAETRRRPRRWSTISVGAAALG